MEEGCWGINLHSLGFFFWTNAALLRTESGKSTGSTDEQFLTGRQPVPVDITPSDSRAMDSKS
jgi:hypothetical protein